MSNTTQRSNPAGRANAAEPARMSVVLPVLMAGILAIGGVIGYWVLKGHAPAPQPESSAQESGQTPAATTPASSEPSTIPNPAATAERVPAVVAKRRPVQTPREPAVPPAQLTATLSQIDLKQPITAEQAGQWKQTLQQLVQQGSAAVPAIQDFLTQNHDASATAADVAGQLGYPSLRAGLIDALAQIGGPDGAAAMLQVLQASTVPADLPLLAKDLEAQAPGQYQQQILDATRQQLSMAMQGGMGDNPQVGPLFQVLANEAANGANVSQDLQTYGSKWAYYSTIALASLPDGAGVSSLTQLAQNPQGNSTVAAQVLAQVSSQNPQALSSLIGMAASGQLSDHALAQLAPFLAGEQYELTPPGGQPPEGLQTIHMASGNQDFAAYVPAAGALTQAQIDQQVGAINQILQALPAADDEARGALQLQLTQLTSRRGK
jgi:hypothetical protein